MEKIKLGSLSASPGYKQIGVNYFLSKTGAGAFAATLLLLTLLTAACQLKAVEPEKAKPSFARSTPTNFSLQAKGDSTMYDQSSWRAGRSTPTNF